MGYFCLVLILVLVVSGIICAFVFHKRRLKQLNDIKFFYSNVSKLLRTPVSNLVSQLKSLSGDENQDENHQSLYNYMLGNASRLFRLSDIIAEIGFEHNNLLAEKTDVVSFMSDICNEYASVANQQGVDFKFNAVIDSYSAYIDKEKIDAALYIIIAELVSYVSKPKSVEVLIDSADTNLLIKLRDSES